MTRGIVTQGIVTRGIVRAIALLGGLALASGGCIAPSVLDASARLPVEAGPPVEWRPAALAEVPGFFESRLVEGEAAGALLKLYYWFEPEGRYTGAALVAGPGGPQFQTLAGAWAFADGRLDLGDGQVVELDSAAGHLRLRSDEGCVVLRRIALE